MKLRFPLTVLTATALLGAVSVPSGASTAAYAQMKSVIADANAEQSVRVTSSATESGLHIATLTDAGRTSGRQVVTLTSAGKSDSLVNELVGGTLYVKGDNAILVTYMGLSQATANQLAGQWFIVPTGSTEYTAIAQGLTVSTGMAEVTMTASVASLPATTLAGVKDNVLKGKTAKSAINPATNETFYFSTATKPLPVEVIQSFSGATGTIKLSRWNEPIKIVAPKTTLHLN